MRQEIFFEKDLKVLKPKFDTKGWGLAIKKRQFILSQTLSMQLTQKILFAQNSLIFSSPQIQSAYSDKMGYYCNEETKIFSTDQNIKYSLISAIHEYYNCKDFLKNLLVCLYLDQNSFIDIIKDSKVQECKTNNQQEFLALITSELNNKYCRSAWKSFFDNILKLNIDQLNPDFYIMIDSILKFNIGYGSIDSNMIKHCFQPLENDCFSFSIDDFKDVTNIGFSIAGGTSEKIGIGISIEKTQNNLIEFNNKLVDFFNQFFEEFRFE